MSPESTSRRTAVKILTVVLGFIVNAVPAVLGGLFFLDPVLRRGRGRGGSAGGELAGFTRLGISVDAVPADGRPIPAIVEADQADAWNLYRNVPVGSIWLRRSADGTIVAFSATCPHLGCSVDYRSEAGDFFCPCHTSTFDLDGIPQNEVPPRSMDRLQVRTATNGIPDPQGTEIWVEFLEFRGSTDQKIPV